MLREGWLHSGHGQHGEAEHRGEDRLPHGLSVPPVRRHGLARDGHAVVRRGAGVGCGGAAGELGTEVRATLGRGAQVAAREQDRHGRGGDKVIPSNHGRRFI